MLDLLLEKHWRLIAVLTESSTMSHQANLFELGGFLSRISILRKPQYTRPIFFGGNRMSVLLSYTLLMF